MSLLLAVGSAGDTTSPVVDVLGAPTRSKISRVPGRDSFTFPFSVNENFQAYMVRSVPSASSPHTAGQSIEYDGWIPLYSSDMSVDLESQWTFELGSASDVSINARERLVSDTGSSVFFILYGIGTLIAAEVKASFKTPSVIPPASYVCCIPKRTAPSTYCYGYVNCANGDVGHYRFINGVGAGIGSLTPGGAALAANTEYQLITRLTISDHTIRTYLIGPTGAVIRSAINVMDSSAITAFGTGVSGNQGWYLLPAGSTGWEFDNFGVGELGGRAGVTYTALVSDDELVTADPADGVKIIKVFAQDTTGNWST